MDSNNARKVGLRFLREIDAQIIRGEIVGAIRRGDPGTKDIDIVVTPQPGRPPTVWGVPLDQQPLTRLDQRLDELKAAGNILLDPQKKANGPKLKRFILRQTNVVLELHIVDPKAFGLALAIYTGDEQFSRKLVMSVTKGGLLPDGWRIKDLTLYDDTSRVVSCEEEVEVFAALGLPPLMPRERNLRTAQRLSGTLAARKRKDGDGEEVGGSVYDIDRDGDGGGARSVTRNSWND